MKKGFVKLLACALVFTLLASACGQSSSSQAAAGGSSQAAASGSTSTAASGDGMTIRFSWWGSQTRHDLTMQVLDLYKEQNPGIEFEMEYLSGPDYNTKLATQAATGQMPDLFQTDLSWISTYTEKGLVADLQPFVDDGTIDTADISSAVATAGAQNGVLYALPFALNSPSMFYDPAVFAEAGYDTVEFGWTWEDYDEIINDVYAKTGVPALPLYYHIPEVLVEVVARQQGYTMYNEDGTALGFDDPAVVEPMFQRILDMTVSGAYVSPDVWSTSTTTEDNGLVLGTASTAYGGSNQLLSYSTTAGRPLAITTLPYEGTQQGAYVRPSMMLSVSETASDEVKAECAKLIDFLLNDADCAKILGDERGVPVNASLRDVVLEGASDNTKTVFAYIEHVEANSTTPPEWAPPNSSEVFSIWVDLFQQVAFQTITPADAAEQLISDANNLFAQNA